MDIKKLTSKELQNSMKNCEIKDVVIYMQFLDDERKEILLSELTQRTRKVLEEEYLFYVKENLSEEEKLNHKRIFEDSILQNISFMKKIMFYLGLGGK